MFRITNPTVQGYIKGTNKLQAGVADNGQYQVVAGCFATLSGIESQTCAQDATTEAITSSDTDANTKITNQRRKKRKISRKKRNLGRKMSQEDSSYSSDDDCVDRRKNLSKTQRCLAQHEHDSGRQPESGVVRILAPIKNDRGGRRKGSHQCGYSKSQSEHVLNLVIQNNWGRYVKGNGLWKYIVKHKLLVHRVGERTYQALRDHFKKISLKLETMRFGGTSPFKISTPDLQRFKIAREEAASKEYANFFPDSLFPVENVILV